MNVLLPSRPVERCVFVLRIVPNISLAVDRMTWNAVSLLHNDVDVGLLTSVDERCAKPRVKRPRKPRRCPSGQIAKTDLSWPKKQSPVSRATLENAHATRRTSFLAAHVAKPIRSENFITYVYCNRYINETDIKSRNGLPTKRRNLLTLLV